VSRNSIAQEYGKPESVLVRAHGADPRVRDRGRGILPGWARTGPRAGARRAVATAHRKGAGGGRDERRGGVEVWGALVARQLVAKQAGRRWTWSRSRRAGWTPPALWRRSRWWWCRARSTTVSVSSY